MADNNAALAETRSKMKSQMDELIKLAKGGYLPARAEAISASLLRLRKDSASITDSASHLTIDLVALEKFAQGIDLADVSAPPPSHVVANNSNVGSAKAATSPKNELNTELIAHTLALNAINFCYWPHPATESRWFWRNPETGQIHGKDDEYNGVSEALTHAVKAGVIKVSDSEWLSMNANTSLVEQVFVAAPDAGKLTLPEQRGACWADLGRGLLSLQHMAEMEGMQFADAGGVRALLMASGWPDKPSAVQFVGWLSAACPGYHDFRVYGGVEGAEAQIEANFLKRSQLCAALLQAVGAVEFCDIHELTVFSDYRVPQLLRAKGVLKLDEELDKKVEGGELIPENTPEEVEIRAATVHVSELILASLKKRQQEDNNANELTANKLDYYLWKQAVEGDAAGGLPKFHKTLTLSY